LSPDDFPQWDPLYVAHTTEEGAPVSADAEGRSDFFRRTLSGDGMWWGAFDHNDLSAIVALNASYNAHGQIAGLYTRPDARRRGLARALTAAVLDDCWHRGLRRLVLLVNDDNLAARQFYESLGFAATDRFGFLFGRPSSAAD
jgi:ribosomal protein S18 acetylase RimI-like enzyme